MRDSSLSACTQAVVAAEVGHLELAKAYLYEAAQMDIADLDKNTADGLHMASLAGTVIATVAGLGGLRDFDGRLTFRPRLPSGLERLRFAIEMRGRLLRVDVRPGEATYSLEEGGSLHLFHWDEELSLEGGGSVTLPIPPAEDILAPRQPPGREPKRVP